MLNGFTIYPETPDIAASITEPFSLSVVTSINGRCLNSSMPLSCFKKSKPIGPGIFKSERMSCTGSSVAACCFSLDMASLASSAEQIFEKPIRFKLSTTMLTGEYDHSCTPEASRDTAALIDGAELTIMEGMGHFPMSEHPELFASHLMPVLDQIRGGAV